MAGWGISSTAGASFMPKGWVPLFPGGKISKNLSVGMGGIESSRQDQQGFRVCVVPIKWDKVSQKLA